MTKQADTQPCPEWGGIMRYEEHDDVLKYRGQERTIKMRGWWCADCDEAILSGEPLKAHERAFLAFKEEVDGVLAPAEIAAARQRLGLSQRKAGEVLGGGPRAFQKYGSGAQAASTPMSNLLRLLANDPSRLREIVPARGLLGPREHEGVPLAERNARMADCSPVDGGAFKHAGPAERVSA